MNYYTPDISEFQVGFECEMLDKGEWKPCIARIEDVDWSEGCNPQLSMYYKWTRDDGKVFESTVNPFDTDSRYIREFRVKYLSGEDLTDYGWINSKDGYKTLTKIIDDREYKYEMILKVNLKEELRWESATIEINFTKTIVGARHFTKPLSHTIYVGYLPKNKFKFKELMKLLNI